jgi:hypothetical protein
MEMATGPQSAVHCRLRRHLEMANPPAKATALASAFSCPAYSVSDLALTKLSPRKANREEL